MSETFHWCQDKTRLAIYDKQLFYKDQVGTKRWVLNDQLHRLDGPAIEYANGTKWWYLNGKRHRKNGPAVEFFDGMRFWYLNGKEYSEYDYWKELKK